MPSIFNFNKEVSPAVKRRCARAAKRSERKAELESTNDGELESRNEDIITWSVNDIGAEETIEDGSEIRNEQTPTTLPLMQSASVSTQTPTCARLSCKQFINDPTGIKTFTGLESYEKFQFVLQSLGPARFNLKYFFSQVVSVDIEEQFFITLMKLRHAEPNAKLARMVGISEATVSNIFITWINFMYCQWKELEIWPRKDLVHFHAPEDFRLKFPTTRVIVDGTECPVKRLKNPKAQQQSFSTYKNRHTAKILVGSTPGGLVSYVSDAYGGSTSDRQIVERSNLARMCEAGDSIMADKGFNVQDIMAPYDVTVNIPAFFSRKNRLTSSTVLKDRKIANKRVHIERIIGLAKSYKILTRPMSPSEIKLSSRITFCCFMLCNFKQNIVPKSC